MSQAPFLVPQMRRGRKLGNAQLIDSLIRDGLWDHHENGHMGELSEKISQQYGISRESQDTYAITSYEAGEEGTERWCARQGNRPRPRKPTWAFLCGGPR